MSLETTVEPHAWYAIYVKPQRERLTAASLLMKGYEVFAPILRESNRWSDRVKVVETALFPGYVFCRFDATKRLPILITEGVVRILGCGKIPVAVLDEEIASLQIMIASGAKLWRCSYLAAGQRVKICDGCLKGVEAVVVKTKKGARAVISIGLLQRSVAVEIECSSLAFVNKDKSCFTNPEQEEISSS